MARAACQPVDISTAPAFCRDIEALRKTHHLVDSLIFDVLVQEIGPDPACGWAIRGWNSRVYKLHVKDTCHNRGKSNGFRLIYDWKLTTKALVLLRLYTHAQMEDIAFDEIKKARKDADAD